MTAPPAPATLDLATLDLVALDVGRLRAVLAGNAAPDAGRLEDGVVGPARIDRHAAVLVALVTGAEPAVLLTRRAATLRLHAGQVAFPGGRIDPDDPTPEAAALREAHEEIGLDPDAVQLIGRLPALVTGSNYHVTPVVGLIAPDLPYTLAPLEVQAVFTLPLRVVRDPGAPIRKQLEHDGRTIEFWVWPHDEQRIWGATARILVELAAALAMASSVITGCPA